MSVEGARTADIDYLRLLDEAPDLIGIIRDGLFWYSNYALRTGLGFDRDHSLDGLPVVSIMHPDDIPVLQGRFARMLRDGERLGAQVYRIRLQSGAIALFETTSVPIVLAGQACIYFFSRDVTRKRHLDHQLIQADRLAALGTLAAGVAHEINNPLSYVILNLEWVARQLPELGQNPSRADELAPLLSEARSGALRVATIVRQLRDFSRINDDAQQIVDLRLCVGAAIQVVSTEIGHRTEVKVRFESPPPVSANAARVEQVLLNLLLTCAEGMDERNKATNEIRVVVSGDSQGNAVIEVSDNGPGIPQEVLSRLFDPFFVTKPAGMGTALGLSICHSIVSTLGGQITVDSESGCGTTFRVTLPSSQASLAPASAPPSDLAPSDRRGRVLVIDDEASILRTMRELLQGAHDVETNTSAEEAYNRIASGETFDVIFCDLMMPNMTGIDLHAALLASYPEAAARMVFMTGGAFTPRASDFLAAVPNPHVEKPFSLDRLERIVHARLRETSPRSS